MILKLLLLVLPLSLIDGDPRLVIREKHQRFTTDNLGNIYFVYDSELIKYNSAGRRLARYSNLRLGNIAQVDATNPLKILVYYADYQQVVFLDNQLSPNGQPVSLQELGLEQAALVCASANNSFWVYDRRNNELHRYDQGVRRIASTGNLRQVLTEEIAPAEMTEHNNFLFLVTPGAGIHMFDIYGTFSKMIPLPRISDLHVKNEVLYYTLDRMLCSYDLVRFEQNCDSSGLGPAKQLRAGAAFLYRSYGDSLAVQPF